MSERTSRKGIKSKVAAGGVAGAVVGAVLAGTLPAHETAGTAQAAPNVKTVCRTVMSHEVSPVVLTEGEQMDLLTRPEAFPNQHHAKAVALGQIVAKLDVDGAKNPNHPGVMIIYPKIDANSDEGALEQVSSSLADDAVSVGAVATHLPGNYDFEVSAAPSAAGYIPAGVVAVALSTKTCGPAAP